MGESIFEFWSRIPDHAFIHPADAEVFRRVGSKFRMDCLPIAFFGPLRTAPVVLLFLSPGYRDTPAHAQTQKGRAYYKSQRDGRGLLPNEAEHSSAFGWWANVVRQFNVEPMSVRDKVAILNIGAYHSEKFHDRHMLAALPSSRVSVDWAQTELFPKAEAGEKVVVCLRSPSWWGLNEGEEYNGTLFAPRCTRGGHMYKLAMRDRIIAAVRDRLR